MVALPRALSARCGNGESDRFLFALFPASKSMQEGWGSSGDDVSLGPSQWEDDGGVWNGAAAQDSSSCSSWGNAPKKGLQKVCAPAGGLTLRSSGRGEGGFLGTRGAGRGGGAGHGSAADLGGSFL